MDNEILSEKIAEEGLDLAIQQMANRDEKVKLFARNLQDGLEPKYDLIQRQIEVYIQTHIDEMKAFANLRRATLQGNYTETGSTKDGLARHTGSIPLGLYKILIILAPNILGAQELTIEKKKKRANTFFKKFPVFQFCEKL